MTNMLRLLHGDALTQLGMIDSNLIDSLVTDPPAGISFMGKEWDSNKGGRDEWVRWMSDVMRECLRVLKPGAHGLVWAIPRTSHWTATALEDAGFEIRDVVTHIFSTGFPKSLNIKKAAAKSDIGCNCETEKTTSNLSDLPTTVYSKEQNHTKQGENLLIQMQGHSKIIETGNLGTLETCQQVRYGSREHSGDQQIEKPSNGKESSLEGRSDLQTDEGELHRSEIREMSEGIYSDGSQGRICNGTPSGNGNAHGKVSHSNRSGPSQGPQYEEQSDIESGMVSKQRSPQTCRSCGKAKVDPGFGTALKPASEHWILVRKPISEKTVAANVLKWGCGGLNIDKSRIEPTSEKDLKDIRSERLSTSKGQFAALTKDDKLDRSDRSHITGRFPANLVLSHNEDCVDTCTPGCAVAELDKQSGFSKSAVRKVDPSGERMRASTNHGQNEFDRVEGGFSDSGGASRFFFQVKHDTKSECKHTFAEHVRSHFKTILPIIENTVLSNVEEKHVELLAHNVNAVERQCDSCAILIARDLVAIKNLASKKEASQAYLDFIGNSKSSILIHNLAFIVEQWVNIGTIPTTQNLSILFGCVLPVIEENTKQESQKSVNVQEKATRFLYCAKASKREKNEGCEGLPEKESGIKNDSGRGYSETDPHKVILNQNHHPTVKPIRLMSYLITMVTPPGGTVLDPFVGSGSTGVAALKDGFQFIGIENNPDYIQIAEARIKSNGSQEKNHR